MADPRLHTDVVVVWAIIDVLGGNDIAVRIPSAALAVAAVLRAVERLRARPT